MTREADIVHENQGVYVHRDKGGTFTVYRPSASGTHALSDATFAADEDGDGLSLAIARADYLAGRVINRGQK